MEVGGLHITNSDQHRQLIYDKEKQLQPYQTVSYYHSY